MAGPSIPPVRRKRVLIVDDEEEAVLILQALLCRCGCDADTATAIEEAERQLDRNRYDVVVTDLRLTGVIGEEGLEILQYVREKSPSTAVILITGFGNPQLMTRAYELGAACYFEKPVDPARLMDALERIAS